MGPQHQSSPGAPQQPRGHSCGYSCGAPHISQLLQTITNRLLHFSSAATRASVTFFCIIAFLCLLSSLPGFLIQSASTWCSPPLSSACPCPPCSQATSSTPPSPSSTPSAPSSSSCPACTSSMLEASLLEIPLVGVSGSPVPTQLGTNI